MPARNEVDYRGQIFSNSREETGLPVEVRRQNLCKRLEQGILVTLLGESIHFLTERWRSSVGDEQTYRVSARLPSGLSIASCDATRDGEDSTAVGFEKRYGEKAPPHLKGIGLVTTCTALFYQVLIAAGIEQVGYTIQTENLPSFSSQFLTPDLFSGHYFFSRISRILRVNIVSTQIKYADIFTALKHTITVPQHFNPETDTIE